MRSALRCVVNFWRIRDSDFKDPSVHVCLSSLSVKCSSLSVVLIFFTFSEFYFMFLKVVLLHDSDLTDPYPYRANRQSSFDSAKMEGLGKNLPLISDSKIPAAVADHKGFMKFSIYDVIYGRYVIVSVLGKGGFGEVVKAKDNVTGDLIALKIIKNTRMSRKESEQEIRILKQLATLDKFGNRLYVKFLDWFEWKGHFIIAMELLGVSISQFLEKSYDFPFPMGQIRHIAYQICYAVNFLHLNGLTHTDLTDSNIVFVNSDYEEIYHGSRLQRLKKTDIRLIDFGCAVFDNQFHPDVITARYFRAPEVILNLGWDKSNDIWSIGCILFELYYPRNSLFRTIGNTDERHLDLEHLAMMEQTLGPIPISMSTRTKTGYFRDGTLRWDKNSMKGRIIQTRRRLHEYMTSDDECTRHLFDLIKKMLVYEPEDRITLREALCHPFFQKIPDNQRLTDLNSGCVEKLCDSL